MELTHEDLNTFSDMYPSMRVEIFSPGRGEYILKFVGSSIPKHCFHDISDEELQSIKEHTASVSGRVRKSFQFPSGIEEIDALVMSAFKDVLLTLKRESLGEVINPVQYRVMPDRGFWPFEGGGFGVPTTDISLAKHWVETCRKVNNTDGKVVANYHIEVCTWEVFPE